MGYGLPSLEGSAVVVEDLDECGECSYALGGWCDPARESKGYDLGLVNIRTSNALCG